MLLEILRTASRLQIKELKKKTVSKFQNCGETGKVPTCPTRRLALLTALFCTIILQTRKLHISTTQLVVT